MLNGVLQVCDPLTCVLRRVAVELFEMFLCCVLALIGLFCKAISLGMVQFQGRFCTFYFRIYSTNTSNLIGVRVVTIHVHCLDLYPQLPL